MNKRLQADTKKNQKNQEQICCPSHNAGPPPHLALAIAPARNQVSRDELIPCQANIESTLLLNISTSYIEVQRTEKSGIFLWKSFDPRLGVSQVSGRFVRLIQINNFGLSK